jgi:hypothetical protein
MKVQVMAPNNQERAKALVDEIEFWRKSHPEAVSTFRDYSIYKAVVENDEISIAFENFPISLNIENSFIASVIKDKFQGIILNG